MINYIVKYGQSIYDIATEVYGNVSAVENIIRDNEEIYMDTVLEVGQVILIDANSSTIVDQSISNYFRNKDITNNEVSSNEETQQDLSGSNFGTIITNSPQEVSYINNVMWKELGQISMRNAPNSQSSNIFVDGDNGTFNDSSINWNITVLPYSPSNPEYIGSSFNSSTIGNEYFGLFNTGASGISTQNNPHYMHRYDTAIDVISGNEYILEAEIYFNPFDFESGQRDNFSIYFGVDGYDDSELEIVSAKLPPESYGNLYAKKIISTKFTAKSSTVNFFHKGFFEEDIGRGTGGIFLVDNITLKSSIDVNSENKDRIVFDSKYTIKDEGDFIEIKFNPKELLIKSRHILIGDSSSQSSIELVKDTFGYSVLFKYGDGVEFNHLISNIPYNEDSVIRIDCSTYVGIQISKSFNFNINGNSQTVFNDKEFCFDSIGGGVGNTYGYDGIVSELSVNGDVYNFNENKGIYINKK